MKERPVKILLIEDEIPIIKVVKLAFAVPCYALIIARNIEEGVKKASQELPDLIVLDIRLPTTSEVASLVDEKGGMKVYEKLKSNTSTKDIPIIILTAVPEHSIAEEINQIGVQGCIYKPFNEDELIRIVEENLNLEGGV